MKKRKNIASVTVRNVSVAYDGKPILKGLTIDLFPRTITALVGPNGGGKSTLFKSIMNFISPYRGEVLIFGMSPSEAQKQNKIAYVPQSEDNDWNFPISVYETVMMGRYAHMNFLRIPKKLDHEIVDDSLSRVNMATYKNRQIGALSGGQKKRVFLARALAQGGEVILLDEPFTGVDAKTEMAIVRLLLKLKSKNCTILVSTHDLNTIPRFCDQVIMLDGKLIAQGDIKEVFTNKNIKKTFGGMLLNLNQ